MCCFLLYNSSNCVKLSTKISFIGEYPFWFLSCIILKIFFSAPSIMSSTSSVGSYPRSIISFAVFIRFLNTDFSSTIFIYFVAFAVVGTFSGNSAKYSNPPTCSNFPIVSSSDFTVIKSIGSALLYKFSIAEYIILLSSL